MLHDITLGSDFDRVVSRNGVSVRLSVFKFAMFLVLFKAEGRWVTRDDLLEHIRPEGASKRYTDWKYKSWNVTMFNLRNSLKPLGLRIEKHFPSRCRMPGSDIYQDKRGRASFRLAVIADAEPITEEKAA